MNHREIISLMHKLFYGDIDSSDGYVLLFSNDRLDKMKFEIFLSKYIEDESVLIYVTSQNVCHCPTDQAFDFVSKHISENRIRISNASFTSKILIEPTGVGVGHLIKC